MYNIKPTSRFAKDVKLLEKRKYKIKLLTQVIKILAAGEQLDKKYLDHALHGEFEGCRECHINPDWLLIYEISHDDLILYLTRTGTHNDLFG